MPSNLMIQQSLACHRPEFNFIVRNREYIIHHFSHGTTIECLVIMTFQEIKELSFSKKFLLILFQQCLPTFNIRITTTINNIFLPKKLILQEYNTFPTNESREYFHHKMYSHPSTSDTYSDYPHG